MMMMTMIGFLDVGKENATIRCVISEKIAYLKEITTTSHISRFSEKRKRDRQWQSYSVVQSAQFNIATSRYIYSLEHK